MPTTEKLVNPPRTGSAALRIATSSNHLALDPRDHNDDIEEGQQSPNPTPAGAIGAANTSRVDRRTIRKYPATPTEQLRLDLLSSRVTDDSDEQALGKRIRNLLFSGWVQRFAIKQNREQLQMVKTELSRDLHRCKQLLARPGREGGWAAFLREHQIPKATAERYVKKWEESQNPNANRTNETIAPPTSDQIKALVKKNHPKLVKFLRTEDSQMQYLEALTLAFRESPPIPVL